MAKVFIQHALKYLEGSSQALKTGEGKDEGSGDND